MIDYKVAPDNFSEPGQVYSYYQRQHNPGHKGIGSYSNHKNERLKVLSQLDFSQSSATDYTNDELMNYLAQNLFD